MLTFVDKVNLRQSATYIHSDSSVAQWSLSVRLAHVYQHQT